VIRTLLVALAAAMLMAVFPALAFADDPGYGTYVTGPALNQQQYQQGQVGATQTSNPAPPPNVTPAPSTPKAPTAAKPAPKYAKRCVVNKKGTRICTYYKNGRSYKRCTRVRGSKKYHCKKYTRARLRAAAAMRTLRAAAITQQGWANPIVPAIGRFYAGESSTPNKGWCSGTLILRGVVLTAAHCVYANGLDRAPDGTANHYYDYSRLVFTPGNTINTSNPLTGLTSYGNWSVKNMWATNAWVNNDQSRDWALVELNPDASGHYPGDYTRSFPVWYGLTLTVGQQMQAIGYPASYLFNSQPYFFGNGQYFVTSTINSGQYCGQPALCGSVFINYDSTMTGGSSGGPIFYNSDGQWKLSGVVNRGQTQCLCTAPPANDYGKIQLTGYMDSYFNDFYTDVINQINNGA
jgi:V8-like Glu-specific endopeptidase